MKGLWRCEPNCFYLLMKTAAVSMADMRYSSKQAFLQKPNSTSLMNSVWLWANRLGNQVRLSNDPRPYDVSPWILSRGDRLVLDDIGSLLAAELTCIN